MKEGVGFQNTVVSNGGKFSITLLFCHGTVAAISKERPDKLTAPVQPSISHLVDDIRMMMAALLWE